MRLENTSNVSQQVWDKDGREYELAAGSIQKMQPDVGKLFLEQCSGEVIEFKEAAAPTMSGVEEVWVANNTGNPNFPMTVEVESEYKNPMTKKFEKMTIEHPLREPHTIKHSWDQGQADIWREGRLIRHANLSAIEFKLPPFYRRKLPMPVVYAWQSCLNFGPAETATALITSREPTMYEPNETWDLDKVLAFGCCMNKHFKEEYSLKLQDECEGPVEADQMKRKVLDLVYFLVIDPAKKLPPEKAVTRKLDEMKVQKLQQKQTGKLK